MSLSTPKRLFVVVVAGLAFVSYLGMRDTVQVECELPRKDVRAIISGLEEWSAPKLFRHIEIERGRDGLVFGSMREPGGHWSVTVFTNQTGVWKKCGWCLLGEDKGEPSVVAL
ncbi:hypothetical protein SBV1_1020006 [Verrucomicrobia bacterium]|nr:hypothetical protein SBV1_1020006 [Verrucomicrobiota bacterium]